MKIKRLAFWATAVAGLVLTLAGNQFVGVAYAVSKPGKPTYVNSYLICDCTSTTSGCGCVV
jgi:hypothetical protein